MSLSPEKILFIGFIALMVLGPDKLPHAARTAGKMLAEFRRLSSSVQDQVTKAVSDPSDALGHASGDLGLNDIRKTLTDVHATFRGAVNEVVTGATAPMLAPRNGQSVPVVGVPELPAGPGPGEPIGGPSTAGTDFSAMPLAASTRDPLPSPDDPSLN